MYRDALVVGINGYDARSQLRNLSAPARDAEAIARRLTDYGNFRVTRLPAVVNKEHDQDNYPHRVGQKTSVSRNGLRDALTQLFTPAGNHIPDTALFYFSGHGLRETSGGIQEGYLASSDANPDLGHYGLSLQWLRRLLQASPVRQQIIWLDCCHAGELLNFQESLDEATPGNREARDRCFIAACREYEAAFESVASNHGVLTGALLQALDPERHSNQLVTNFSLTEDVSLALRAATQRPLFANFGNKITLIGTATPTPSPFTVEGVCPYRGLAYFDQDEDARFFHGRSDLTDCLIEKVRTSNFVTVVGASGSGKSSVVRAGLLYQLKQGQQLSGSDRWSILAPFRPGEHPLQSLAEAFVEPDLSAIVRADRMHKAQELINAGGVGFTQIINAYQTDRVVLVIDQFEECFTLCRDRTERQQLFESLLAAVEQLGNKLCLVLTLRADFLSKCLEVSSGFAKKIQESLITVPPMSREELRQAITQPAEQVSLQIEPELVNQMILDVENSPGSLPLLQYTLTQLWQRRPVNWLTIAAYNQLGGVRGALQQRADAVYTSLSPEQQKIARCIFLELTQLGEGTEDTRRQVLKRELVTAQQSEMLLDEVIQVLANERLIVTSELVGRSDGSERIEVIDIAHEALIRYWSQLRQWIEDNRLALKQKRSLEDAAEAWLEKGKQQELAYLLQGPKLAEAEAFLRSHAEATPLSQLAQEFVQVSQSERDRSSKAARRRRIGTIVGIGVACTAAFGFLFQSNLATQREVTTWTTLSESQYLVNQPLKALIDGLKSARKVQQIWWTDNALKLKTISALSQALQAPESHLLEGHTDGVCCIRFSPDGKTIASASWDKTVKLWTADGKFLRDLSGHQAPVEAISFSSDGNMLASASADGIVKLWQVADSQRSPISIPMHQPGTVSLSFSPNKHTLAITDGNQIQLWEMTQGKVKWWKTLTGHQQAITSLSFSLDGRLASASLDGTVLLWDLNQTRTGKRQKPKPLLPSGDTITSLSFSPNGKLLAIASLNLTVKFWQVEKGTFINTQIELPKPIKEIGFSPDGTVLAVASTEPTVSLWDVAGGNLLKTLQGHHDRVTSVNFSPTNSLNGYTLASASDDKTVRLWKWHPAVNPHHSSIADVSFSPDGKLFASASFDTTVKLWNAIDGSFKSTLPDHHTGKVTAVSFSSDSRLLAAASEDKTVKLWSLSGGSAKTLAGHTEAVTSVAFSPNSEVLASGSVDRTIRLWRVASGALITQLVGHQADVTSIAFSPNGQLLASASLDKTIRFWQMTNGAPLKPSIETGIEINSIAFSPDGNTLAVASRDNSIRLWRVLDRKLIQLFTAHSAEVTSVSFSPDGQTLASGSADKTIKLWNAADGTLIRSLYGHQGKVTSVRFSPDGTALISSDDEEKTVRQWNLSLDTLLKRSCDRLRDYLNTSSNVSAGDRELCPANTD